MEKKTCNTCNLEKEKTYFYFLKRKNIHKDICLYCEKEEYRIKNRNRANEYANNYRIKKENEIKEYRESRREEAIDYAKNYRKSNKDKVEGYQKKYRIENSDKAKNYRDKNKDKSKEYRIKNKDRLKELNKKYRLENRDKINRVNTKRRKENPLVRLSLNIRNLIKNSFLKRNHRKAKKTVQILGCTVIEFKQYIENKWESWMNWGNYGMYDPNRKTWQLDHIIPVASAKTEFDIIRLNHYSNFQPLLSFDNLMKSDKINLF